MQELFNKALSAINDDEYITEEEYFNMCKSIPKGMSILPSENAVEDAWDTHMSFKYNLISMTLIQLYSLWEKQKNDYNAVAKKYNSIDKIQYNESINELRLLNNSLKHGYGDSYDELKKRYPRYIALCEANEKSSTLRLNISSNDVDRFTDVIVSFWNSKT